MAPMAWLGAPPGAARSTPALPSVVDLCGRGEHGELETDLDPKLLRSTSDLNMRFLSTFLRDKHHYAQHLLVFP